jgi:hypothetical protein
METQMVNGEIVSVGWLTVMSLCVTISGFIIFFANCTPFTKFRRVLFIAILVVVAVILYLLPEAFTVSGTVMLSPVDRGGIGGIGALLPYILNHLGANAAGGMYRLMTLEQLIFIGAFALLSYPLYLLTKIVIGKFVDRFLFSSREYLDE